MPGSGKDQENRRLAERAQARHPVLCLRLTAETPRKQRGARHGAAAPAAPLVQTIWPDRYDDI